MKKSIELHLCDHDLASEAEKLLEAARQFNAIPSGGPLIISYDDKDNMEWTLLAVAFAKLRTGILFAALFEGWDLNRCAREVHN